MKDVDDVGPHTKCQNTIVLTIHDDDDDDTKCVCVMCTAIQNTTTTTTIYIDPYIVMSNMKILILQAKRYIAIIDPKQNSNNMLFLTGIYIL